MAFLFKSKKSPPAAGAGGPLPPSSRKLSSRDGSSSVTPPAFVSEDEKFRSAPPPTVAAPLNPRLASSSPTPAELAMRLPRPGPGAPQRPAGLDASLYPWSTHPLQFVANANPFPRYGAAANAVASKEGDIYLMGGLIEGATVKGDLWIVEGGTLPMTCYPVPTTAEGPGPRVGHASLLVGNAFIVFGGDTKVEEHDALDDTLYLLNTSTKHWSRALPAGPRPAGRYGHTLNILGSKIYLFGGQVEGYFFNDLVAFDLNALQTSTSHWEMLIENTTEGGPLHGQVPPARTNHTVVTYNEKLYLFGGTDGLRWFNDVWTYDPRYNSWTQQECIGFIPAAREGHAAALVGDVMYVFGGRTHEGKDLGDVAGFRIPTCRWYTFQNMGPSPSPRSGHGMTAFGNQILILGGEPSSAPRNPAELSEAYVLDTSKIRYPDDKTAPKAGSTRRPSITERSGTPQERSASRDGSVNGTTLRSQGSQDSMGSATGQYQRNQDSVSGPGYMTNGAPQKPTRSAPSPAPAGPLPQPRANGLRSAAPAAQDGGRQSPVTMQSRSLAPEQGASRELMQPSSIREQPSRDVPQMAMMETYSPPKAAPQSDMYSSTSAFEPNAQTRQEAGPVGYSPFPSHRQQSSTESDNPRSTETPDQAPRSSGEDLVQSSFKQPQYADSGVGSSPALSQQNGTQLHSSQLAASQRMAPAQNESLLKELEASRSKNAWYASELALARKSGYRSSNLDSPSSVSDDKTADAFGDDEKPMLEALLRMRSELTKMQESLATQGATAAAKIAQAEKEKEAALSEAFYAKTKLASRDESRGLGGLDDSERSDDASRRLASALAAHSELSTRMQGLSRDLESERRARQFAEESADVAHTRAAELDAHKQSSTSELERLKTELYETQRSAREVSVNHTEAQSSLQLLEIDKKELTEKLTAAQDNARNHADVLKSLHEAVTASSEKSSLLEQKFEQERNQRGIVEEKLASLRAEHENRVAELDSATSRLRDTEELAESHAAEARTHREAVLAGLGREQDRGLIDSSTTDERVKLLQDRLDEATSVARRHQEAADQASEQLRRAEERIAGLESYQEQTSREGLSLRKQLQTASKEHLDLRSAHTDLQQQLEGHKLDSTALKVQHDTLKNLLNERGVDTAQLSRGLSTDPASTTRVAELEQQLEASSKSHDDMRQAYELREQEASKGWEAKLQALDNDYQSAVRYLKGTEKMLGKMKQELHRYKTANKDLEDEVAREKSSSTSRETATAAWESERTSLRQELESMHARVQQSAADLDRQMKEVHAANAERDTHREASEQHARDLATATEQNRSDVEALRSQNAQLELRAAEAERKVQMLLDTVGTSVSNYRRQSQSVAQANGTGAVPGSAALTAAAVASGHSRGISVNSIGADSVSSGGGLSGDAAIPEDGLSRNSVALDSLATELETLRSHWETTSKSYRRSDQSDVPTSSAAAAAARSTGGTTSSDGLADWRRRLELDDDDDDDDEEDHNVSTA